MKEDDSNRNLPSSRSADPVRDISSPVEPVVRSRSSIESSAKFEKVEAKIDEISDRVKRDNVAVYTKIAGIWLSNVIAFSWFVAHCIFEWHGKHLAIPGEFILLIVSPYGGVLVEMLRERLKKH